MLQMFEEDTEIVIVTSDEAHFHLDGNVNNQNFRSWSPMNPRPFSDSEFPPLCCHYPRFPCTLITQTSIE